MTIAAVLFGQAISGKYASPASNSPEAGQPVFREGCLEIGYCFTLNPHHRRHATVVVRATRRTIGQRFQHRR